LQEKKVIFFSEHDVHTLY